MCSFMPPDEVSGSDYWRVFDKANATVPDDIKESTTQDCWAWD